MKLGNNIPQHDGLREGAVDSRMSFGESGPPRLRSSLALDADAAAKRVTATTRNAIASEFSESMEKMADAVDLLRRSTDGDDAADADTERCNCLVSAAAEWGASRGELMSQAEGDAFFAACMLEPDEFEKALASQKVNVEACKPWWKRRSTKVAAGVVASLLVVGLVVRSRRK